MSLVGRIHTQYRRRRRLHSRPMFDLAAVSVELNDVQPILANITTGTEEVRSLGLVIEDPERGISIELRIRDPWEFYGDMGQSICWYEGIEQTPPPQA